MQWPHCFSLSLSLSLSLASCLVSVPVPVPLRTAIYLARRMALLGCLFAAVLAVVRVWSWESALRMAREHDCRAKSSCAACSLRGHSKQRPKTLDFFGNAKEKNERRTGCSLRPGLLSCFLSPYSKHFRSPYTAHASSTGVNDRKGHSRLDEKRFAADLVESFGQSGQ